MEPLPLARLGVKWLIAAVFWALSPGPFSGIDLTGSMSAGGKRVAFFALECPHEASATFFLLDDLTPHSSHWPHSIALLH